MDANAITEAGIATILDLAEATPRRLSISSADMDGARLSQAPAPDGWSALDILNHIRACEEVWMHSVHAMLAHENPNLQEIHPRQWIKEKNPYTTVTFSNALKVFTLRREALLITLRMLKPADWAREGRIERKTHTVYSHLQRMVSHEEGHCTQIEELLKG